MDFETILPGLLVYGGVVLAAFWLALVIWAYRDMRARSRDPLAAIFVAISIILLNVPGVFIYIMLRPRETLAEAYERSLEEEALLQEIEEKPTCPGCSQNVKEDWLACPYCHTRLKKPCATCNYHMELSWDVCPNCASQQTAFRPDARRNNYSSSGHVQRTAPQPQAEMPEIDDRWLSPDVVKRRTETYAPPERPDFVDDNY